MIFVCPKFHPSFPCLNLNVLPFYHYFVSFTTGKYGVLFRCQSRYILIYTWKSQSFCMWMFPSCIHDSQKLYSIQMPINRQVDKQTIAYTCNKNTTLQWRNSMNESQKYTISERSQTQKAVPCIFHLYEI